MTLPIEPATVAELMKSGFRGPWPAARQILLLRAALACPGAREALARWERTFDTAAVDPETLTLLPLLSRSLHTLGISSPYANYYHDVFRRLWYRNQLLFAALSRAMAALDRAAIPTLLLKGVALAATTYEDEGLRPMSDTDLLVPSARAADAARVLSEAGFTPTVALDQRTIAQRHSIAFHDGDRCPMDLHWHVIRESVGPADDEAFWAASMPIVWKGVKTRTLCPADELLLVIAHGIQGAMRVPPIHWIADAATLLRRHAGSIDWQRFQQQAVQRQLTLTMRLALDYLADTFDAPVPAGVRSALASYPVARSERLEYWLKVRGASYSPLGALPRYWFTHRRLRRDARAPQHTQSFVGFLKDRHDVTPGAVIRRATKLPFQQIAWFWQQRRGSRQ